MTSLKTQVESTSYGGFTSYGASQVSTHKPGIKNQYYKDVYADISDYNKRNIDYFEDKLRYGTVYQKDYLFGIHQGDYKQDNKGTLQAETQTYHYGHEPNVQELMRQNLMRNEAAIREK